MSDVKSEKILVAGEDDINVGLDSGVEDRLVGVITDVNSIGSGVRGDKGIVKSLDNLVNLWQSTW